MSEQNKPFVITDRRKFTAEGELRPDAETSHRDEEREATTPVAAPIEPPPPPAVEASPEFASDADYPPPPTAEQTEQANAAYRATAERLDTAIRAANPGADH